MIHYRAVIIDGGEAEFGWQRAQRDPFRRDSSEENGATMPAACFFR